MNAKTEFRRAVIKCIDNEHAFELSPEHFETYAGAKSAYGARFVGFDTESAKMVVEATDVEVKTKMKSNNDMVLPTHAYEGEDE